MTRILFVCFGNICRSPMAEFIVCPPARRKLAEHGISCAGKTARQLTKSEYKKYDLLIGMDQANLHYSAAPAVHQERTANQEHN